jgi:hypothetical protein
MHGYLKLAFVCLGASIVIITILIIINAGV